MSLDVENIETPGSSVHKIRKMPKDGVVVGVEPEEVYQAKSC